MIKMYGIPIKVLGLRFGFATNSSSTHSIVFVNPKDKPKKDDWNGLCFFGWDYFVLVSKEAKVSYLEAQLFETLRYIVGKEQAKQIAEDTFDYCVDGEIGVDHGSRILVPVDRWNPDCLDVEFAKDFEKFILRNDVVILGGNDNTIDNFMIGEEFKPFSSMMFFGRGVSWARKDSEYGYWVIFNPYTGNKIRFKFDNDFYSGCDRASVPELIDLNITDKCDKCCPYCYKDSNASGKYASLELIFDIIESLSDLQVFEVALGGGDPVSHPYFLDILERCRDFKMIPNFSTKSLWWVGDDEYRDVVFELCGQVGISISSYEELVQFIGVMSKYSIRMDKIKIHLIPGVVPYEEFIKILKIIKSKNLDVLFLAPKKLGRGKDYDFYEYDLFDAIDKVRIFKFGVDTLLASQYENKLKKRTSSLFYEVEEGKYSMYIDAVSKKFGKSSFSEEFSDFDNINPEIILEFFRRK